MTKDNKEAEERMAKEIKRLKKIHQEEVLQLTKEHQQKVRAFGDFCVLLSSYALGWTVELCWRLNSPIGIRACRTKWNQLDSSLWLVSIIDLLRQISRLMTNKGHECLKLGTEWEFTVGILTVGNVSLCSQFCIWCLSGWINCVLIKWGLGYQACRARLLCMLVKDSNTDLDR